MKLVAFLRANATVVIAITVPLCVLFWAYVVWGKNGIKAGSPKPGSIWRDRLPPNASRPPYASRYIISMAPQIRKQIGHTQPATRAAWPSNRNSSHRAHPPVIPPRASGVWVISISN